MIYYISLEYYWLCLKKLSTLPYVTCIVLLFQILKYQNQKRYQSWRLFNIIWWTLNILHKNHEPYVCVSHSVVPNSLRPHGLQSTRFLCPWDFPGKDTWKGNGVGCHFLLQGIFPTQGSNPGLLYCRQILYRLSYKGSPFIKR